MINPLLLGRIYRSSETMKKSGFDFSVKRLQPVWLIVGVLIGHALGLFGGLNLGLWYFASPGALIGWQIFGAVFCALFCSFMMTSNAPAQTKGAVLGMGIGFALAFYVGDFWTYLQPDRDPAGPQGMIAAEGIFFDWLMQHAAWLGLIVGWVVGNFISRKTSAKIKQEADGS